VKLKHPQGWFAAGREVSRAIEVLSDAAFKLYIYICLHAERNTGCLDLVETNMTRALGKSPQLIQGYIKEMELQGVCRRWHAAKNQGFDQIEVCDDFWPYEKDPLPFEIAHIDHTQLDVELVCSETGHNLGRPWMTLVTDAFSRRMLATYVTFDPPSYRSCMMVLRECVRRHARLPQIVVVDYGGEFESVYFETLLARYECTKKTRPPAAARFGSVCERILGWPPRGSCIIYAETRRSHGVSGRSPLLSIPRTWQCGPSQSSASASPNSSTRFTIRSIIPLWGRPRGNPIKEDLQVPANGFCGWFPTIANS
jgi:transposase InsO family protein